MLIQVLKNRVKAFMTASRISKRYRGRYLGDPNFDLAKSTAGLAPRGSLTIPPEGWDRIVAAYRKAKTVQKTAAEHFQVSNEWLPIYERSFGKAITALSAGDRPAIEAMYRNFFRDPVSVGLHGLPVDMQEVYFSGHVRKRDAALYLIDAVYRYRLWQQLVPSGQSADLVRPDIGNPYGVFLDGNFVTPGAEYQQYYASQTLALGDADQKMTVFELGGGYGGYAYFVGKLAQKGVRYIDVDLPEVLALATFYLLCSFPEKKFVLYGETENYADQDCDFLMLPNFAIDEIAAQSVDVIFNSYSLAEMSPEAIYAYVAQFGRIGRGHLLHINHVETALLGADSFRIENAGFELVYRKKALWNMGRNLNMDEYEFLYRKAASARSGVTDPVPVIGR
jgi:hypothetical protein